MIFGNIQNLGEYPFLEEQIKECFAYAKGDTSVPAPNTTVFKN